MTDRAKEPAGPPVLEPETVVYAGDIVDTLSMGEGTVVLARSEPGHRVVRLSLLGSEILDAVGDGTSLAALEEELRRRLGDPADGGLTRAMHAALISLAETDVVRIGTGRRSDT